MTTSLKDQFAITSPPEAYCRRNGILSLRLFGSQLHGLATENSDIDLLVEFENGCQIGLLKLSQLELELSDMMGRKVDLRTATELSRYFRPQVLSEAKYIYGE